MTRPWTTTGPLNPCPTGLAPDDLRPLGRPGLGERRSAVHAVALGTEKLRPVLGRNSGSGGKRQERRRDDQASWHGTAANIPPADASGLRRRRPFLVPC